LYTIQVEMVEKGILRHLRNAHACVGDY